jgi:polar amino acid transport system substrate-binding protein
LTAVLLTLFASFSVHAQTVLRIASPEFPPYVHSLENGKIGGMATEIVAEVFRSMGVGYEHKIYPWARALDMLKKGKVHALFTIMKNKKRAAIIHYPDEFIFDSKWVFFIRRADAGSLKFDSFDDLKGKRIGLARDTKYNEALWEFVRREKNYEITKGEEMNLRKLVANRIDLTVCDYVNGMAVAKEIGVENDIVALTANPVESSPLYIAFSMKIVDRRFVDIFSDELKKFKKSDRYMWILKKYNISQ